MYYIVEHPSRGCVVAEDWRGGKRSYKCSYSILRSDRRVLRYYDKEEALAVSDELKGSYVLRVHRGKIERLI